MHIEKTHNLLTSGRQKASNVEPGREPHTTQGESRKDARPYEVEVTNEQVARLLVKRQEARYLYPFFTTPTTIGQAARVLNVSPNHMFRKVKKLLHLNLLEVAYSKPRRGRSFQYYQTTAQTFRISFDVISVEEMIKAMDDDLHARYERNVAHLILKQRDDHATWAMRVSQGAKPELLLSISPGHEAYDDLADSEPVVLGDWTQLSLTFAEAKVLQRTLAALRAKHAASAKGDRYLLGLFLTPLEVS